MPPASHKFVFQNVCFIYSASYHGLLMKERGEGGCGNIIKYYLLCIRCPDAKHQMPVISKIEVN